jgi:hypothetical protein
LLPSKIERTVPPDVTVAKSGTPSLLKSPAARVFGVVKEVAVPGGATNWDDAKPVMEREAGVAVLLAEYVAEDVVGEKKA